MSQTDMTAETDNGGEPFYKTVAQQNGLLLTRQQAEWVETGRQAALLTGICNVSHQFCQRLKSDVLGSWLPQH